MGISRRRSNIRRISCRGTAVCITYKLCSPAVCDLLHLTSDILIALKALEIRQCLTIRSAISFNTYVRAFYQFITTISGYLIVIIRMRLKCLVLIRRSCNILAFNQVFLLYSICINAFANLLLGSVGVQLHIPLGSTVCGPVENKRCIAYLFLDTGSSITLCNKINSNIIE